MQIHGLVLGSGLVSPYSVCRYQYGQTQRHTPAQDTGRFTKTKARIDAHTPPHCPPQPHELETTIEPIVVLESEGRSLQQGGGKRMRKRVATLALYSRASSGCRGARGLPPEPLCEMRTLQKRSLERDRKSTGDCRDKTAVKRPLAIATRETGSGSQAGRRKATPSKQGTNRMTQPKPSILKNTGRVSNC